MRQYIFHEETKTFHLYNGKISYILCVLENGHLGQLYFGKRLHDKADFSYLVEKCERPMTSYIYEWDRTFSLEHIRQEYPVYGTTDYSIRQLNCCRKTAAGSVSSNMTVMRLLMENQNSPDCRQLIQSPREKRRHCAFS